MQLNANTRQVLGKRTRRLHREGKLADQVARAGADDSPAEHAMVVGIEDQLGEIGVEIDMLYRGVGLP